MSAKKLELNTICKLSAEVDACTAEYIKAVAAENRANIRTTECLNALNTAQGALDDALNTAKSQAPNASDWSRYARPKNRY